MTSLENLIISSLPQISRSDAEQIVGAFDEVKEEKGKVILQQGSVCRYLYFLVDGVCRYYTNKGGNEVTTWFGFKNNFVTSFTSFFPGVQSYETIKLLTDCTLYRIHADKFEELKSSLSSFQEIVLHFITQYTVQLERRLLMIQTQTAAEKYQHILQNEPELILQIPNKDLASYLGVSRETLSRIRSSVN